MVREVENIDIQEQRMLKAAKARAKREHAHRLEKRSSRSNSVLKLLLVGIAVLIQLSLILAVIFFLFGVDYFSNWFTSIGSFLFYSGYFVVCFFATFTLFRRDWNSAFKLSWLIIMFLIPIVGLVLYFMLGRKGTAVRKKKKYAQINGILKKYYEQDKIAMQLLEYSNIEGYREASYLYNASNYTTYKNTDVTYYAEAKDGLNAQIDALKKAEKFIFMEYHAIENAESFKRIKDVLIDRASHGVEVRLFYDEMGSIGFINKKFKKELESYGVKCRIFNPLTPIMVFFMNNRDHRKITVIDGKVGFTGGYNLANEYFDVTHPYGEWKDTGIKLEGDAVKSLTLIFLENWNGMIKHRENMDYDSDIYRYVNIEDKYVAKEEKGIATPFADGPTNGIPIAENAYINLINSAKKYCYITTPYLLITDEMVRALTTAAQRGVDVRIITPGIPDKKFVYKMTRSYYVNLVPQGVKVFEYTPGFLHAKMMLVDDHAAIIGTINFDYRSLYHHYENACVLYNYDCIKDIKKDFDYMLSRSRDVTVRYKDVKGLSIAQAVLRLFAPLL